MVPKAQQTSPINLTSLQEISATQARMAGGDENEQSVSMLCWFPQLTQLSLRSFYTGVVYHMETLFPNQRTADGNKGEEVGSLLTCLFPGLLKSQGKRLSSEVNKREEASFSHSWAGSFTSLVSQSTCLVSFPKALTLHALCFTIQNLPFCSVSVLQHML